MSKEIEPGQKRESAVWKVAKIAGVLLAVGFVFGVTVRFLDGAVSRAAAK